MHETSNSHIHHLDIGATPKGTVSEGWFHIVNNGIGEPIRIPIMVARGMHDGPVLGLTAAIHGNELNGIPVIQKLVREMDLQELRGTIVGGLAMNVPGMLLGQRKFNNGEDLNHIAPGKPNGTESQVYINRIVEHILKKFDYLVDIHTASFGRINSYYIRADMNQEAASRMARLQNPEIILNNPPHDGTFRGMAAELGIPAITLEMRDPNVFQDGVIEDALVGIRNVLYDLKMMDGYILCPVKNTILCERSYWVYTDEGGLLTVHPRIKATVKKGDLIADVRTIFGKIIREYFAPDDGIVIGKSINPVNQTGSRILHLGINPTEIPCITEEQT